MLKYIAYNMKVGGLMQLARHAILELQLFHPIQEQVHETRNNCGTAKNMKKHTQLLLGIKI